MLKTDQLTEFVQKHFDTGKTLVKCYSDGNLLSCLRQRGDESLLASQEREKRGYHVQCLLLYWRDGHSSTGCTRERLSECLQEPGLFQYWT